MPNHCDQQVYLSGPHNLLLAIWEELTSDNPQLLQLIKPMPFETYKDVPDTLTPNWYDWRIENWGCKWDIADIDGVQSSFDNLPAAITGKKEEKSWVSYNCWTAWGPPIPVWQAMHDLGIEVDADYQDEGGMFEGHWENGIDDNWDPDEGEDIDDD